MIRFLVDEDFDHTIVRGLLLRSPALDVLTVQESGRFGSTDVANLGFAVTGGRVLLTHDKRLIPLVRKRVERGDRMPGVFVVHQDAPIGAVISDLALLGVASDEGEWEGQVLFVSL